jgi:hypothetical protein
MFWVMETLSKHASHYLCADFHAIFLNVIFKLGWAEESS